MSAISLKELVNLTDDEIKERNAEDAEKYIKMRDMLKNDEKPVSAKKPKRKCTDKQLAALAAGRAKNPRMLKKKELEEKAKAVENAAKSSENN